MLERFVSDEFVVLRGKTEKIIVFHDRRLKWFFLFQPL